AAVADAMDIRPRLAGVVVEQGSEALLPVFDDPGGSPVGVDGAVDGGDGPVGLAQASGVGGVALDRLAAWADHGLVGDLRAMGVSNPGGDVRKLLAVLAGGGALAVGASAVDVAGGVVVPVRGGRVGVHVLHAQLVQAQEVLKAHH